MIGKLLFGPIVELVKSWGNSWLENNKIKTEGALKITEAKVNGRVKRHQAKADMDVSAQYGMQYSWKDEYLVIILSAPAIMCFIPGLASYAMEGFKILETVPDWYKWAFTGVIAATFGLRTWIGFNNR